MLHLHFAEQKGERGINCVLKLLVKEKWCYWLIGIWRYVKMLQINTSYWSGHPYWTSHESNIPGFIPDQQDCCNKPPTSQFCFLFLCALLLVSVLTLWEFPLITLNSPATTLIKIWGRLAWYNRDCFKIMKMNLLKRRASHVCRLVMARV